MSRAMRIISVERGQDPSTLSLVAFGGAGPVHATRLARQLKIGKLVVPIAAGVTSALGLLVADMRFDFVRTCAVALESADISHIKEIYENMKEEADRILERSAYSRRYIKAVDMRYVGQAFELTVPFGEGFDFELRSLKRNFLRMYQERYGYVSNDPIECVSWRLITLGIVPKVNITNQKTGDNFDVNSAIKGQRRAYFEEAEQEGFLDCAVYDRYKLFDGAGLSGPAIVEERESTCVILPSQRATVDQYANLIIEEAIG
jgi:N-methylhydantoinase A